MINYYTGTPPRTIETPVQIFPHVEPSVEVLSPLLKVEPNSVIIIRASRVNYNLDDLNTLRDYFKNYFPNNKVCVIWDDIDIQIMNDNSWHMRPCAEVPYDDQYTSSYN